MAESVGAGAVESAGAGRVDGAGSGADEDDEVCGGDDDVREAVEGAWDGDRWGLVVAAVERWLGLVKIIIILIIVLKKKRKRRKFFGAIHVAIDHFPTKLQLRTQYLNFVL